MLTYKFRVILDTEEDVFRDIEIDQEETFENFYKAIILSFDFVGKELASFYMSNEKWDKGREIGLMDMGGVDSENENLPAVMSTAVLKNFVKDADQKIILVYDFLKMWCFYIELQEEKENTEYEGPVETLSYGEAPSEDSKEYDDPFEGIDLGEDNKSSALDKNMAAEIDDIMNEYDEFGDEPESFENIDDLDI